MKIPVFDLHCDTAFTLLDETLKPSVSLRSNNLHFDLERAGNYPAYAQCFACFSSPLLSVDPERLFAAEFENIRAQLEHNVAYIASAENAAQIRENMRAGRMSAILSVEGPAGFGYDPARLESLYHMGFRLTTLSWNEANPLTGSHLTGGGLSDKGRAYVTEAQRLGMIVDVSHISDEAFYDIMRITHSPIVASHSNSRTVCNHSRNLTDEMFRLICETDGVVGINFYAEFVGSTLDLDGVCNHIMHFLQMDPDGKHIALGGDLDGCDQLPAGIYGVQSYERLADALVARGLDEGTIGKIFWSNALGVMERCCT